MILYSKSSNKTKSGAEFEERLLDLCYNSLILLFGEGEIESLKSSPNIEIFKKDVKVLKLNFFMK